MKKILFWTISVVAGLLAVSCGKSEKKAETVSRAVGTPVVMGNLVERDFTSRLMLKGTLEPTVHTTVAARVSGTMLKVLVEEGDSVEAGQLLFTIDERNYRDKYEVASATLEAQKSAVEVARAQVEKAEAGFRKSSLDVERYRRLREKERVSANELEAYELKYDSAKADLSLAKANLSSQEAQVALAEANLSIAKKNLDDCSAYAPFSGRVSGRLHEPGEEIKAETGIIRLVSLDEMRAVASLPAEYYSVIRPGETVLRMSLAGNDGSWEVKVTDKSPVIEKGLRTFQVRGTFGNPDENLLVPGQLVDLAVNLKQSHGLGVPLIVPVRRASGLLLYTVVDGKAKEIAVTEGISEDGVLEVSGEGLNADLPIVFEGQYMIQDGEPVLVK